MTSAANARPKGNRRSDTTLLIWIGSARDTLQARPYRARRKVHPLLVRDDGNDAMAAVSGCLLDAVVLAVIVRLT
jgi:hypothetical protein